LKLIEGIQNTPWKLCVYGPPGIGKSSLAAKAPKPLLVDLEKGLDRIDGVKTPFITQYQTGNQDSPGLIEVMKFASESEFETIVFDTVEGIENIILKKVLDSESKDALADFPYGKGWELLETEFKRFLDMIDRLTFLGKNIIIVAHDNIEKFDSPTSENYDRYNVRIHKRLVGPLTDRMDAVLFCRYQSFLKSKNQKDFSGNEKKRAVGEGIRVIQTEERPAWIAKNRFNLDETSEFSADIFNKFN